MPMNHLRQRLCRGVAVVAVVTMFGGCSADRQPLRLTMRNREVFLSFRCDLSAGDPTHSTNCRLSAAAQTWVAANGRATSMAFARLHSDALEGFGVVDCNDQQFPPTYWTRVDGPAEEGQQPLRIELDDGSAAAMSEQSIVAVWNQTGDRVCLETTGTWTGTAGKLQQRSGTYRMTNDTVQTLLRLTED
jgi:hypothetical protein